MLVKLNEAEEKLAQALEVVQITTPEQSQEPDVEPQQELQSAEELHT